jgi:hypothetical protein
MRGGLPLASTRIVLLHNPAPDGPVLGTYGGKPIASAVIDEFGRRYVYAGVSPRRRDGRIDEDALQLGEWVTESGLIYRADGKTGRKQ